MSSASTTTLPACQVCTGVDALQGKGLPGVINFAVNELIVGAEDLQTCKLLNSSVVQPGTVTAAAGSSQVPCKLVVPRIHAVAALFEHYSHNLCASE